MPPLLFRLLALPANIRLEWEGLPGTKHSSLLQTFVNYGPKKFYNVETRCYTECLGQSSLLKFQKWPLTSEKTKARPVP
jgi:hypothetical protein